MPVTKLVEKQRQDNKVKRIFDAPQTPYHCLLDSPEISDDIKQALRKIYNSLDAVDLWHRITQLDHTLLASTLR